MKTTEVDVLLDILHALMNSDEGPPFARTPQLRGTVAFERDRYDAR